MDKQRPPAMNISEETLVENALALGGSPATRAQVEMTRRSMEATRELTQALKGSKVAADRAARRLEVLTVVLIILTAALVLRELL